jgi:Flagellar hook-length control protein FliK
MKEGAWTEKVLAILKSSPNGVKNGAGNSTKGEGNSLSSFQSQLTEKEGAAGKAVSGKAAAVLTSGEAGGVVKDLLKTTAEKAEEASRGVKDLLQTTTEKAGEGRSAPAGNMVSGPAGPDTGSGKIYPSAQGAGIPDPALYHTQSTSSVSRVLDSMQWMVEAGQQKTRIQLSPPELGHIDIQLVIDQGHLRASLGTESMHVKEMIQSNLGQLKQELSQMGFVVDEFNVNVGADNRRSSGDGGLWERKVRVGSVKGARGKTQAGPILQGAVPVQTRMNTDYQVSVRV